MNIYKNYENYNCRITSDDGQEFLVYSNLLSNENINHWKGWECYAGCNRLMIDKNLNVWSGECKNDFLGTATDKFFVDKPTICKGADCRCTDDLSVRKHQL